MRRQLGRRRWCPLIVCLGLLFILIFYIGWDLLDTKSVAGMCSRRLRTRVASLDSNLLLVLVHSSVSRGDRRNAIRETWLADYQQPTESSPVHYRFVLGGADLPPHISEQLQDESERHKDIIILPSNPDNALNLTQRTVESFRISIERFSFSYVLKCDEDTYADVPRLTTELQERQKQIDRKAIPLYWGEQLTWEIYEDGYYGEKQFTVCNRYLPYALGGGYVLSRDLVKLLVELSPYLHRYVSEDVSVGAWLAPFNVEYRHDMRFNTGAESRGCKDPFLVTHKVDVNQMYAHHRVYTNEGRFCSPTNRDFGTAGHVYKWAKLPSRSIKYSENYP